LPAALSLTLQVWQLAASKDGFRNFTRNKPFAQTFISCEARLRRLAREAFSEANQSSYKTKLNIQLIKEAYPARETKAQAMNPTDSAQKSNSSISHAFVFLWFKKFRPFRVTVRRVSHSTLVSGSVRSYRIPIVKKKSTSQLGYCVASARKYSASAFFNTAATAKDQP
jgi:hypothetical protein